MAEVKLDGEALQVIITKAILDNITDEKRDELISNAVGGLLGRKVGDRYDSKTQIEIAFEEAVRRLCEKIAEEELLKPGPQAEIRKLVNETIEKAFGVNDEGVRKALVEKMASAVQRVLMGDRY